jgi:hypothetical protein
MRILKYRKTDRPNPKNSKRHQVKVERVTMPVSRAIPCACMRGEDKGKEGKILRVLRRPGGDGREASTS